jgi:hypothetical protein
MNQSLQCGSKKAGIICLMLLLPILAFSAGKTSLSSGYGIDAARWSASAGTGTISSDGSATVTGIGTVFTAQLFGAPAPSILFIDGKWIGAISSITDNSTLILSSPPVGGAFVGQSFTHQTVPMPGDNVTVAAGHAVTIMGWGGLTINDLTIMGTGSLETDCNLFNITGNLVIDGDFIQDPGSRIIIDGSNSAIGGAVWPVTMRSLRVKTTTLPAVVILHAPVVVSELLDIEDGTIDLNSQSLTTGTDAGSPGALLIHAAKYNNLNGPGMLTRWFAPGVVTMSDTKSSFPLSAGEVNRNVWVAGSITGGGTISVTQSELSGTTPITITDNATIFNKRSNTHWTVLSGNGLIANTVQLRVQASAMPGILDVSDLTMMGASDAAAGSFSPSTIGTTPSDYQVNRSMTDQSVLSGTYYIGVTADSPLPVSLMSFHAGVKNGAVLLQWNTATETNNYGFEVERNAEKTSDALSDQGWTTIGFANGHGTTNAPQSYNFADIHATGAYAYRLKQIDRDGRFTYSKEIEASISAPAVFALSQNYPNPFNPSTDISFTVPSDGLVTLKIYNAIGQEVATLFSGEAKAGTYNQVQFNASGLASGLYFSRLEYDGKMQSKKMTLLK